MSTLGDPLTISLLKNFIESSSSLGDMVAFFDIDHTILYPETLPKIKIIKEVVDFYHYLKSKGVTITVITARPFSESNLRHTVYHLKKAGIEYDYLYLRPVIYEDIRLYKYYCRKYYCELSKKTPLCSIGDNWFDVLGGYTGVPLFVVNNPDT
jgi:hypothetical protein